MSQTSSQALADEGWAEEEGGLFGRWVIDESGLPAYKYTYLDRANPDISVNEDHWHQVANDRFTAEAHAGGWMVPYRWVRGLTRLSGVNPKRPEKLAGVGVIRRVESGRSVTLLHSLLPEGHPWLVIWGEGYAEWRTEIDGLSVRRRVSAPFGDDPVLIIDVEISGDGAGYEYEERWPVEPYAITLPAPMTKHSKPPKSYTLGPKIAWHVITGVSGGLRRLAELWRASYSRKLKWKCEVNPDTRVAVAQPIFKKILRESDPDRRAWRDLHPQPVFMAPGEGGEAKLDIEETGRGIAFIARAPFDVSRRWRDRPVRLRFIFGWGPDKEIPRLLEKYKSGDVPGWAEHVPKLSIAGEGWVEREMSWHGYYLRSMLVMDDYFENHYLPQASAYGYLHGIHGAPRDYALATVPMIYIAPDRAREMLLQMMRLMYPSGEMLYGHGGFGKNSSAGGMHAAPTDLPVFLLWTIVEYIGATGDTELLDERVPFYPKEDGLSSTVRERVELAWYYLRHKVGKGPHGLLRVGTGDWNDPISLMVPDHKAFVKKGESAFNTAFAIYVLPKVADVVESWDARQAREMREYAGSLGKAMDDAWTGEWYLRGWDGKGGPIGEDRLFLDSNVWALISGAGGPERMRVLVERIGTLNDDPSPIGANILDEPVKVRFGALVPGWDCNGGVWAAINGLLAWGYSIYDPERAWQNLYKQSMAGHSRAYPHVWFGIWSAPDAYNAHYAERPGETFIHPITPMQEYPIMNSNAHALPLLALIKIAGIEPRLRRGAHLTVNPRLPGGIDRWRIDLPLIDVKKENGKVRADYHRIEGFNFPSIELGE